MKDCGGGMSGMTGGRKGDNYFQDILTATISLRTGY